MAYTVIWLRGPLPLGTKTFDALAEATLYAEENLADVQTQFNATAVKIVDDEGTPHYLKAISRNP
jgi:hypothetical protein